ncbi:hypothetical protein [Methylobacterium sp. WL9]|uniref:hypothetical protein n=1 Tax=Methylobacterium sp. WL9 TaxID=2603898 RepID=UPI0011CA7495|nr:hypothetical protein [Methylobacterium sp. WL9]TXN21046.1 hypothetical protein FV217_15945 [Methylobacterium sp. WL9]
MNQPKIGFFESLEKKVDRTLRGVILVSIVLFTIGMFWSAFSGFIVAGHPKFTAVKEKWIAAHPANEYCKKYQEKSFSECLSADKVTKETWSNNPEIQSLEPKLDRYISEDEAIQCLDSDYPKSFLTIKSWKTPNAAVLWCLNEKWMPTLTERFNKDQGNDINIDGSPKSIILKEMIPKPRIRI